MWRQLHRSRPFSPPRSGFAPKQQPWIPRVLSKDFGGSRSWFWMCFVHLAELMNQQVLSRVSSNCRFISKEETCNFLELNRGLADKFLIIQLPVPIRFFRGFTTLLLAPGRLLRFCVFIIGNLVFWGPLDLHNYSLSCGFFWSLIIDPFWKFGLPPILWSLALPWQCSAWNWGALNWVVHWRSSPILIVLFRMQGVGRKCCLWSLLDNGKEENFRDATICRWWFLKKEAF